ncbi:MAG: hypothetical protein ACRED5_15470, partial [Propylenella sp.]
MSMPEPETTAAIILGSSSWPDAPKFEAAPQFAESVEAFRSYLRSASGFGMPYANVLNLFDSDDDPSTLVTKIAKFLGARREELRTNGSDLEDILLYYVGHGGFDRGPQSTYFLAIKKTNPIDEVGSSLTFQSIRRALSDKTKDARHYLILDCCFAAAAVGPYMHQSATAQSMMAQWSNQAPEGTAILAAAGAALPARVERGEPMTMFSRALLEVLENGAPREKTAKLSLHQLSNAVTVRLKASHHDEAVLPEVHSPEQAKGNIASVPLFPNRSRLKRAHRKAEILGRAARAQSIAPAPSAIAGEIFGGYTINQVRGYIGYFKVFRRSFTLPDRMGASVYEVYWPEGGGCLQFREVRGKEDFHHDGNVYISSTTGIVHLLTIYRGELRLFTLMTRPYPALVMRGVLLTQADAVPSYLPAASPVLFRKADKRDTLEILLARSG